MDARRIRFLRWAYFGTCVCICSGKDTSDRYHALCKAVYFLNSLDSWIWKNRLFFGGLLLWNPLARNVCRYVSGRLRRAFWNAAVSHTACGSGVFTVADGSIVRTLDPENRNGFGENLSGLVCRAAVFSGICKSGQYSRKVLAFFDVAVDQPVSFGMRMGRVPV